MRELSRRLAALETRSPVGAFRRVVIVAPGDPMPPDSDDLFVIRIVAAEKDDDGKWILPDHACSAVLPAA